MALDRWIALILLIICATYGYAAFFTMDHLLPPIMQRNPVWPSSFPKILAVGAMISAFAVLIGLEKSPDQTSIPKINLAILKNYNVGQALLMLTLMVAYAIFLRPAGFLAATFIFLTLGSFILGERRWWLMIFVAALAAGGVWFLVDEVLGIFLRPLPVFIGEN